MLGELNGTLGLTEAVEFTPPPSPLVALRTQLTEVKALMDHWWELASRFILTAELAENWQQREAENLQFDLAMEQLEFHFQDLHARVSWGELFSRNPQIANRLIAEFRISAARLFHHASLTTRDKLQNLIETLVTPIQGINHDGTRTGIDHTTPSG